ncbi:hypothetical protein [Methylocucumis oryzae]|uniref:hypothetical protein n=1 Tax=Methylocucumis oryzae TaxID=1632867 RepID=UPI000B14D50C
MEYLAKFIPAFNSIIHCFVELTSLNIGFYSGWDADKSFEQVLTDDLEKDLRYGHTHSGPHRADLIVTINNTLAKDFVSRGQLKLLVLSLKLTQIQLLASEHHNAACILIDDFAAELDVNNRVKVLNFLSSLACQVFVTATDIADFGTFNQLEHCKMFHVEHGQLKAIN